MLELVSTGVDPTTIDLAALVEQFGIVAVSVGRPGDVVKCHGCGQRIEYAEDGQPVPSDWNDNCRDRCDWELIETAESPEGSPGRAPEE